jgi:transcriptional regulator with XRE-family HTH domain
MTKQEKRMISTGLKYLDRLSGGFRLGDNVVWQISDGIPIEHFTAGFMKTAEPRTGNIVYVNFNYSPHTVCKRFDAIFKNMNITMIDAFTHGKGKGDAVFLDFYHDAGEYDISRVICVENPQDPASFFRVMNGVQEKNTSGSLYVFDSLTGMSELWKDEQAVLDFFSFTCPKLYDLNTVAYWIFEREAHSREFIAGLTHITQVVLTLNNTGTGYYELSIKKLEGRSSFPIGSTHYFRAINGEIEFQESRADTIRIGKKVKELRKLSNITQADLAGRLSMTPGAISQIENDIISPSLSTLVHLSSFFGRPIEYFIGADRVISGRRGFSLIAGRAQDHPSSGQVSFEILSDESMMEMKIYRVRIKASEKIGGPIFFHKGKEFISVLSGSLGVVIDGGDHVIRRGESMLVESSFIERWSCHGRSDCEFIYLLY